MTIACLLVWFDQSRKQFCLSDDKCVTVWKRIGGNCYIIPGKYDKWTKPQNDYILIDNLESLTIIWLSSNHLLINGINPKIINKSKKFYLEDYDTNEELNDSLYLEFDGKYFKYKKKLNNMYINAEYSQVRDIYGNKLSEE